MAAFIQIQDLRKEYQIGLQQVTALAGIKAEIQQGEFVALMGPSGSGKSTLLNVLGGLDHPSSGQVVVADQVITELDRTALCTYRRKRLGFIFQKFNLLNTQTALENVAFPLIFAGVRKAEREAKAKDALQAVGLGDRLHHRPGELSGGQQQRVAIARALVGDPPIILADEPTGNLDTTSGAGIMRLLAELNSAGRTIIVVTHDPRLKNYVSRTIHLLDGHLVSEADYLAAESQLQ